MEFNIKTNMNLQSFENRENLRNAAKNILKKQGTSENSMQKILDLSVFDKTVRNYDAFKTQNVINAAMAISLHNSLRETSKYLKNKKVEVKKKEIAILGSISDLFSENEENNYDGELKDFEIDFSVKNIFAAA